MSRIIPILLAATAATGCDSNPDKLLGAFFDLESHVVVLAREPVVLTKAPRTFFPTEPMKVIGRDTSVCLALAQDVPLQDMKVMDAAFASAMHGARVRVDIVLASGDRVSLNEPLQAWRRYGEILKSDELSACASTCKSDLPVGSVVKSIEVRADPDLKVAGVYWHSERAPLEKDEAPKAAPPAIVAASKPGRSCKR